MFYCATGTGPVFYELQPKVGEKVYVSRWSVNVDDLGFMDFSLTDHTKIEPEVSSIMQFFDTKFTEPIHDSYSYRYKVTALITEFLLHENLFNSEGPIAGLKYTSAAYPGCAENLAIIPSAVDKFMTLDFAEEYLIEETGGDGFLTKRLDFASRFGDDGRIFWEGRARQWEVPPKSKVSFTMGAEDWVATDENGNEIDPR